jgi:hypothetical protein
MRNDSRYNVAGRYIRTIEAIEIERDKERLAELEEERALWHDRMIARLKREGILFKDRDHVTRIAYRIVKNEV